MNDDQKIKQFVNDVYLTKFNRFVDTLLDASPDADALAEIDKVARWATMWGNELLLERDYEGRLINWKFLRYNDIDLGTIATVGQTFTLSATYKRLVVSDQRPVTITQDGATIARFAVVDPNQQTKRADNWTGDRVSQVRTNLLFSRLFRTYEVGGHIIADVLKPLPALTKTSAAFIDTIPEEYYELAVLGVAKNASLPGIVEGGLSPSFAQKYADLLDGAKADNQNTSEVDDGTTDDYGYIGMI